MSKFQGVLLSMLLGAMYIAGCATTEPIPDGVSVTSSSDVYTAAARSLLEPCMLPAEFGRCGCYLDGLQTSCAVVSACLDAGFCTVAMSQVADSTVTTESDTYRTTARNLLSSGYCAPEFRQCGCTIDGIQTSCDIVDRCLKNGFCTVAIADQ